MRLLTLVLRIVFILFVIRMVVTFFRGLSAPRRATVPPGRAPERVGGELVRDAVCGTFVPRTHAIGALIAGRMEYFCSTTCRDKALKAL